MVSPHSDSEDMKLHIAGVYHFDPTCRTRLRQWLEQLSAAHAELPAFVAVEYDADLFAQIKAQRTAFRRLLSEQWPDGAPELLDELELSLGYDGDTHERVFPGAKVVWLDQGRMYDVGGFAYERLIMYHQFLGEDGSPQDTSAALRRLSQQARQRANAPTEGNARDRKFADVILEEIQRGGGDWAIVIVGATHASHHPGRMSRLLKETGQLCDVSILHP